ncbi:flagellar filament capping protein FliD [Trichloromonas sp.]|uniref:flagellar filament capping protein FliD n=1 Tax=Trichloromonas sp. TaxID=3069249 RepID=UPI002A3A974D|nr:flagellar filament capping protein FliD [Trichloromonas sp.]
MSFTLGGLASGMDTNAIVEALVGVKRTPITRLEERKTQENARLTAIKTFDSKLDALLAKADALETGRDLLATQASASSDAYLSATATSSAVPGSYQIKVGQLAQVEKSVYQGVADKSTTTFGTGSLQLSHAGLSGAVEITIDENNNTLEGIRDAINAKSTDSGVTASIINDGSGTPYRLVLTGKTVQESNITLDASSLTGGAAFPIKDADVSRSAQQAIVQVDGVTILSDSNTLTEAIPGVTLDLKQAASGFDPNTLEWDAITATNVAVTTDNAGIQKKVEDFVSAFNDLVKASKNESLANDSGVQGVLRSLRSKLFNSADGSGLYQLGIKTEKDGSLAVDATKLSKMISDNLDGLKNLLSGDDIAVKGIADQLKESLTSFTNPTTGLLAGRQSIIESSLRSLDKEIARGEDRLLAYEEQLYAKYSAMEQMVSSMNSQASYFSQQAAVWSNMGS